jgi:hypothetical protein
MQRFSEPVCPGTHSGEQLKRTAKFISLLPAQYIFRLED